MCSEAGQQSRTSSAIPEISDKPHQRNDRLCSSDVHGTVLNNYMPVHCATGVHDAELPLIMAGLNIHDTANDTPDVIAMTVQDNSGMMTRSRAKSENFVTQNRRCNLKPAKMDVTDVESYYLNKKFQKPLVRHLETIYEEPLIRKNGSCCILGPKKSRKINFTGVTKAKDRKRKANVSKMFRNSLSKRNSFTPEEFLNDVCGLKIEDVCKTDVQS